MELVLAFQFPRLLYIYDVDEAFEGGGLFLELLDPCVEEGVRQPMPVPLHEVAVVDDDGVEVAPLGHVLR